MGAAAERRRSFSERRRGLPDIFRKEALALLLGSSDAGHVYSLGSLASSGGSVSRTNRLERIVAGMLPAVQRILRNKDNWGNLLNLLGWRTFTVGHRGAPKSA